MKCSICGMIVEDVDEAIDEGWTPYFYEDEHEHGPACPSCSEAVLHTGDDGEIEVKQEYRKRIKYLDESPPHPGDDLVMTVLITKTHGGKPH